MLQIHTKTESKMPLPNCGYNNKEEKKFQELVFEGPPEIVEDTDSDEGIGGSSRSSSSGKRVRAKVTTGTNYDKTTL